MSHRHSLLLFLVLFALNAALAHGCPTSGLPQEYVLSPEDSCCLDGHDNDADGAYDCMDTDCAENTQCIQNCFDWDLDGLPGETSQCPMGGMGDCNDNNPYIYYDNPNPRCDCDETTGTPLSSELCGNGVDDNCDGRVDEECTCVDLDGDGYGFGPCLGPDCNDDNADVNPGASEICNDGIDNDCDDDIDCDDSECSTQPICQGCTPQCAGKECGPDGCSGSCGTCGSGESCQSGQCVATCTPACSGKECGPDGCGGTCGSCGWGESCQSGQCVATCTPNCNGKECGSDGCGGSCGSCDLGYNCESYQCVLDEQSCNDGTPQGSCADSKPRYCNAQLETVDNCQQCGCPSNQQCQTNGSCASTQQTCSDGTERFSCSENQPKYCSYFYNLVNYCSTCGCPTGLECQGDGTCAEPGCQPTAEQCNDGTDNDCDADIDCDDADCSADPACQSCTPQCAGKECGSDGCGGSCGTCGSDLVCDGGQCVAPPEQCNGVDDDGDGEVDEGFDSDSDGYYPVGCSGYTSYDCDDTNADRYPGNPDVCDDGIDQDCSGEDRLCSCEDSDGDGHAVYNALFCPTGDDCNDANRWINPSSSNDHCSCPSNVIAESCGTNDGDGIDQDCNGQDLICSQSCSDGTPYGACNDAGEVCSDGTLTFDCQSCPAACADDEVCEQNQCVAQTQTCPGGTLPGRCNNQREVCDAESLTLAFDCEVCGCSQGLYCQNNQCLPVPGETPPPSASPTPPSPPNNQSPHTFERWGQRGGGDDDPQPAGNATFRRVLPERGVQPEENASEPQTNTTTTEEDESFLAGSGLYIIASLALIGVLLGGAWALMRLVGTGHATHTSKEDVAPAPLESRVWELRQQGLGRMAIKVRLINEGYNLDQIERIVNRLP